VLRTTTVTENGNKLLFEMGKNYSIRFEISNNKPNIRFKMENHYCHSTKE